MDQEQKKSFLEELAGQILKWDKQLDELKDKAAKKTGEIKTELKEEYNHQINELKTKKAEVTAKLDELKKSSDEAWTSLKSGIEKATTELKSSIEEAISKFK